MGASKAAPSWASRSSVSFIFLFLGSRHLLHGLTWETRRITQKISVFPCGSSLGRLLIDNAADWVLTAAKIVVEGFVAEEILSPYKR